MGARSIVHRSGPVRSGRGVEGLSIDSPRSAAPPLGDSGGGRRVAAASGGGSTDRSARDLNGQLLLPVPLWLCTAQPISGRPEATG